MSLTKAEKVARIDELLGQFYPNPPIPLNHKDPYTLLIAVLLSAQCTDARVNTVTPKLFAMADNPKDMSVRLDVVSPRDSIWVVTRDKAPTSSNNSSDRRLPTPD